MRNILIVIVTLGATAVAVSSQHESDVHPAKISAHEIAGAIFERENMIRRERDDGRVTLDVTSLLSSDEKFEVGMYKSGKSRFESTESYGVDEFMYFVEGGVTLTSSDGTVTEINAGDAVTIPKEWTGTWDTEGYTKIWVIYTSEESE